MYSRPNKEFPCCSTGVTQGQSPRGQLYPTRSAWPASPTSQTWLVQALGGRGILATQSGLSWLTVEDLSGESSTYHGAAGVVKQQNSAATSNV